MTPRRGFSLVELLVVVTVVVMLMAILLPSMRHAIAIAMDVKCRAQMRSVGHAFLTFAADHAGVLPGVYYTHYPEEWTRSWMGNETWLVVPTPGTLLPYVGGRDYVVNNQLYRCPGLEAGALGSGVGSNGMFDYVSTQTFHGARVSLMPNTVEVRDPTGDGTMTVSPPLVLEEDPTHHINTLPYYREPGHASGDRLGSWHPNHGGNLASLDGGVTQFNAQRAGFGPAAQFDWTLRTPSGAQVPLHHANTAGKGPIFGEWNRR